MNLQEINEGQSGQKDQNREDSGSEKTGVPESVAGDILMDYEQLAEAKGAPANPQDPAPSIGLSGGQPKGDKRGLDISQYTGPQSKDSNQIDDPQAPYGTGPGNGLSEAEKGRTQ